MEPSRQTILAPVRSMVVKLGTQLLTSPQGQLDAAFLATVAAQIVTLQKRGLAVTLVSSGAIGAGMAELNLPKRPTDLSHLQAVAAVGQRRLMDAWADAFSPHHLKVAQLLLTREDVDDRTRFLNLRNTIHAVQELGAVPIVNENDSISTDELVKITFGDNDTLAALVAHAMRADLLVLLSVVDGLLDAAGEPVRYVSSVTAARELVRTEKSALGKGGMDSKLSAAQTVTDAGSPMVVAHGRMPDVLLRLLDGEAVGTLFVPAEKKRSSRNRWINLARPAGTITVDAGAVKALVERQKSLLPAGIVSVAGEFARGDLVAIAAPDGTPIARGLCNYSAVDLRRIQGLQTAAVRDLLAEAAYDEVVHRDNLVISS